jgi:hypothetical protein
VGGGRRPFGARRWPGDLKNKHSIHTGFLGPRQVEEEEEQLLIQILLAREGDPDSQVLGGNRVENILSRDHNPPLEPQHQRPQSSNTFSLFLFLSFSLTRARAL